MPDSPRPEDVEFEPRDSSVSRFRRRLPDLVLEAVMITFALLLALAAEEWRERRDRLELADRALTAVAEEIRANRDELERNGPENAERLERGRAVLEQLEAGMDSGDADIGMEVSLLTSAAWESARMSQAVQTMDLDIVRQLSETYEVQDLYERFQLSVVDGMGEIMRIADEDPEAAVRQGVVGLGLVVDFNDTLIAIYTATLEMLERE